MLNRSLYVIALTVLLVAACKQGGDGVSWTTANYEFQAARCKRTFLDTWKSLTPSHSSVYCYCIVDVVKARWSPDEVDNDVAGIMAVLQDEGHVESCMDKALEKETVELPESAAADPHAQWAARWVTRCSRIMSAPKGDSIDLDRDICECGTRQGAIPEEDPDGFREELTVCLKETFGSEEEG